MKRLIARAALILAACFSASPALTAEFPLRGSEHVQNNWEPNRYEVFCGGYNYGARYGGRPGTDLDTERNAPCFPASLRALLRRSASQGLAGIRETGFRPPPVFGPRHVREDGTDLIRMYQSTGQGFASTSPACDARSRPYRPAGMATISFGRRMLRWEHRPHMIAYMTTHELMHVVQHGYPVWQEEDCGIPAGWIAESTADAVAIHLTRQAYPNAFPPTASNREAQQLAGLRRYDFPLNVARRGRTGVLIHYRTSSFWRHLAEAYHDGEYEFIHRYFRVRPDDNDWLRWLDNRLQTDPQIGVALSIAYTSFVADYATWGDRGRPGEFYGRFNWQARAFNGCETLYLSPDDPQASLDLGLRRTAARCIRVHVRGVGPGDRASVKIAALAGGPGDDPAAARLTDQLQLGFAGTTDRTGYSCARWSRRHGRNGALLCVLVPDTGAIKLSGGDQRPARVWRVRTNEAGVGGDQESPSGDGFTNLYVMTRVAVRPSATPPADDGGDVLETTVYFVLDVSRITASPTGDRTSGDTGSDSGRTGGLRPNQQRRGSETRVVGTLNMHQPALAQEALPTYNPDGSQTVTHTNPAQFRPNFNLPIQDMMRQRADLPDNALWIFNVGHVLVEVSGPLEERLSEQDSYSVIPLQMGEDGLEPRPIAIGETGTFLAGLMGAAGGQMFGTPEDQPARLQVLKHTRQVIHLRISGRLCRYLPPPPGPGCHGGGPFEAEMIKAFPAAYTPSGRFTVYDTPGTAIYRSGKSDAFRRRSGEDPSRDDEADGGGGGGGGGGGSSSATVRDRCDCSCEAFDRMRESAEEMRDQDPADRDVSGAMRLAECMQQCMMEYSQCGRR